MKQKNKTGDCVVDKTGEIVRELYEGDKIVTKEQSDYVVQHIINFNSKNSFVKTYRDVTGKLVKELTSTEFLLIHALIPFISYSDNILRDNKKFLTIRNISDSVLKKEYKWTRDLISSLEKKDVIKKIKWTDDGKKERNCIVVNPYICFRGADIRREIVELFEKSKWSNAA